MEGTLVDFFTPNKSDKTSLIGFIERTQLDKVAKDALKPFQAIVIQGSKNKEKCKGASFGTSDILSRITTDLPVFLVQGEDFDKIYPSDTDEVKISSQKTDIMSDTVVRLT